MKYIDIHCHLDFPDYGVEISEVLARMQAAEIGAITIGTDLKSSKRAVEIAEQNQNIWACIGMHPIQEDNSGAVTGEESWREFEELLKNPKVVAIGECGLDFFRIEPAYLAGQISNQTALFKKQIELALTRDKPLMLHCREAYDEVLGILESYKKEAGQKLRGNAHFFAGNVDQAKRFLNLGFSMSFTGVVTFTRDYDEVIKFLPKESIMAETDAPFVAPVPYRGQRNEPVFVLETIKRLAAIRNVTVAELSADLLNNAQTLFRLEI